MYSQMAAMAAPRMVAVQMPMMVAGGQVMQYGGYGMSYPGYAMQPQAYANPYGYGQAAYGGASYGMPAAYGAAYGGAYGGM